MRTFAIILVCLVFVTSQESNTCPSDEKIIPCTCTTIQDSNPSISCTGIKSSEELVKAVNRMKGLSVSDFNLQRSDIGSLPAAIFSAMEIQSLYIKDTNLTKLSEDRNRPPFLGLENSLVTLQIVNAFTKKDSPLSLLSLSHLSKLNIIHLVDNIIPTIGNNWFESGPYDLKNLFLYNTSTTIIGSHAFEALEYLKVIALTGGYFTEITRDMLPLPALFLEKIDLNKNKLKSLPDNIFSKMPMLEEVFLEDNELTTISEVAFAPVWSQLVNAYFNGNPIICDSNIKWIFKYRTPENFRGRCAGPEKLRNRDFSNLTLSDFQ